MLKKEYVNSFHHNYLKIKVKKESGKKTALSVSDTDNQKLEGLLPVTLHVKNGENSLYYEISSKQSLSKLVLKEKIKEEWIEEFCACLKTALWSLEQYLLDERNLILHPDYIFQDVETGKLHFLYVPYYIEEEKTDMEKFLSFLVENVDMTGLAVSEVLYDIYSKWEGMREEFTPELFLSLWEKRQKEEVQPEEMQFTEIVEPEEKVTALPSLKKKESPGFLFGWNKRFKMEECKVGMAMEDWEYQTEKLPDDKEGLTTYMEVQQEKEERKLYGNGKENRKVVNLETLPVIIGKKKELADVVLADASISRMYARFTEEDGRLYLEDLNATNGTFKNGVRLNPYEKVEILKEDEVKLGSLYFTYR